MGRQLYGGAYVNESGGLKEDRGFNRGRGGLLKTVKRIPYFRDKLDEAI
jgi:hypothetical protein